MSGKYNGMLQSLCTFDRAQLRPSVVRVTHEDGTQHEERLCPNDGGGVLCQAIDADAAVGSSAALFQRFGFIPQEKRDLQVGQLRPHLLVAAQDVAEDEALLHQYGVTHILNLAEPAAVEAFPGRFRYLGLSVRDALDDDISVHFESCTAFATQAATSGGCCLVHCNAGRSRSAAVAAAILMRASLRPQTLDAASEPVGLLSASAALDQVKAARPSAAPNSHFRRLLLDYQRQLEERAAADPPAQ